MKSIPLFIIVIFALGCSKTDNDNIDPDVEKTILKNQKIDVAGEERDYHLYLPTNPIDAPIVMLFHGNKSNNDEILGLTNVKAPYKIWLEVAKKENIILVVPNGTEGSTGDNGWNDCRSDAKGNPVSNDVLFASTLIDFVQNEYQANTSKVFALGTSNGGHMAMRLAQEIPDKLKAFAAMVAANPVNTHCTNSTVPISALLINGTDDPILPYEGGQMKSNRGQVYSAQETIDYWIDRNNADTTPVLSNLRNTDQSDNSSVTKHLYPNGTDNTEVVLYEVIGGGHTEPSILERYSNAFKLVVKEQNGDIEMANEVWNFFKSK